MRPDTDNLPSESLNVPGSKGSGPIEAVYKQSESNRYIPTTQGQKKPNSTLQSAMALPNPDASASQGLQAAPMRRQAGSIPASKVDDDLSIEKEAIARAVAVTRRTSTDPYLQARQIAKIKSDFLRKRYGKDIKLSEG